MKDMQTKARRWHLLPVLGLSLWGAPGLADDAPEDTPNISENAFLLTADTILTKLDGEVGEELTLAYTYLDLANYFDAKKLNGFGRWCSAQFYDELNAARRFSYFAAEKDQDVKLSPIAPLKIKKDSPAAILKQIRDAVSGQTKRFGKLYQRAQSAGDYTTSSFVKGFLDEQVKKEAEVSYLLDRLTVLAGDKSGLLSLDRDLATKTPSQSLIRRRLILLVQQSEALIKLEAFRTRCLASPPSGPRFAPPGPAPTSRPLSSLTSLF